MKKYQTKLGIFVSKLEGSGLIVDNIFKPKESVVSSVVKKIVKPAAKKALTSGTEHIGKMIGNKSGDVITKKSANMFGSQPKSIRLKPTRPKPRKRRGINRYSN